MKTATILTPRSLTQSPAMVFSIRRLGLFCFVALMFVSLSGCSTLSSLGLPFGSTANKMLKSAQHISDAPAQAIQTPSELFKQPLETYLIEIGDTIFVETVSFDSTIRLPGDQIVKPDGTISIGEFGSFDVVHKTIEQCKIEIQSIIENSVRNELEQEYQEERRQADLEKLLLEEETPDRPKLEIEEEDTAEEEADKIAAEQRAEARREREQRNNLERKIATRIKQNQISVRLVNWDSKRVYVLGEVNSPGFFGYTGNQTVLDAIVEAGGLTSKANHHKIIVSRPTPCGSCRIVMKVCYDQVVQLGDTSTNYQLLPGDRVFVPGLTFADDLKNSLSFGQDQNCPRCAPEQNGCTLATGCQ
jgi:polysaccharide export outer membrane protein